MLVPDVGFRELVDHGPFVQAQAAEARGAMSGVAEEGGDPLDAFAIFCGEFSRIGRSGVAGDGVARVFGPCGDGVRLPIFEGDAEPGMPGFELGGPVAVVSEEEIVDGMFAPAAVP